MKKLFTFLVLLFVMQATAYAGAISADVVFTDCDFTKSGENSFVYADGSMGYDSKGYFKIPVAAKQGKAFNYYFSNTSQQSKCVIEMTVQPTDVTSNMFIQIEADGKIQFLGGLKKDDLYIRNDTPVCKVTAGHTYNLKYIYDMAKSECRLMAYDMTDAKTIYDGIAEVSYGGKHDKHISIRCSTVGFDSLWTSSGAYSVGLRNPKNFYSGYCVAQ